MVPMFIQGEYGIGKTSLAFQAQQAAEIQHNIHPIYCSLGGCKSLGDVSESIFQSTIRSRALDPTKAEKITNLFAKYIGKQNLFGMLTLNFEALRADAPQLASPFGVLRFLENVRERLGSNGIFLVLDEINGLARDPGLAHFIKGIVDSNGGSSKPVPLLLALCGVEECRREMIKQHQPVDRIFEVIEVGPMSAGESKEFFKVTFESASIICDEKAAVNMAHYSAGFPKIMQLIGDSAYWRDEDNHVTEEEAGLAIVDAAEEVGKKYFDLQVQNALRSADYRSILYKIGVHNPDDLTFTKAKVEADLTPSERGKFNNFLQKMKKLNVIRSGASLGEYTFNLRMVRLYLWMRSLEQSSVPSRGKRSGPLKH